MILKQTHVRKYGEEGDCDARADNRRSDNLHKDCSGADRRVCGLSKRSPAGDKGLSGKAGDFQALHPPGGDVREGGRRGKCCDHHIHGQRQDTEFSASCAAGCPYPPSDEGCFCLPHKGPGQRPVPGAAAGAGVFRGEPDLGGGVRRGYSARGAEQDPEGGEHYPHQPGDAERGLSSQPQQIWV